MNIEAITFRQAAPIEVGDLALVVERAFAQRDGKPLPTSIESGQTVENVQMRMNMIAAWTIVAANNEKIVGFALSHPLINPKNNNDNETEYLSLLMVDPDHWGKHIASTLLDLTATRARDTGKRRVTLWTRQTDNTRAQAVYEHKGFSLTGLQRTTEFGPQVQYQLEL